MSDQTSPSRMSAKHPYALTVWLFLIAASTLGGITNALLTQGHLLSRYPRLQSPVFETFVAGGIFALTGSVGLLFRKRTGFLLICISAIIVLAVDLYIGAFAHLCAASVMFAILAVLLKRNWTQLA